MEDWNELSTNTTIWIKWPIGSSCDAQKEKKTNHIKKSVIRETQRNKCPFEASAFAFFFFIQVNKNLKKYEYNLMLTFLSDLYTNTKAKRDGRKWYKNVCISEYC